MSEETTSEAVAAPRAKRGIPRTSLVTAETYAQGVWNAARLGAAPDISVVRAISGAEAKASGNAWRSKVAALNVFGLIERTPGGMKLSDVGHAVVKDTDAEAQRNGRRRAVLGVEPYATILHQSAGHLLPSAPTLAGRWEHEFGLAAADAKSVADAFFESVRHAELVDAEGVVRLDVYPNAEATERPAGHHTETLPERVVPRFPAAPVHDTLAAVTQPTSPARPDALRSGSSGAVEINMTIDMSKWPVEDILRVLEVFGYPSQDTHAE